MEKEEAIKILKNFHDKSALFSVRTALETLHPEFKESEDEKIRKELIKVFSNREKYLIDQSFGDITVAEALAWLEKQGEHANFRNKIQIGDKVTRNRDGVLINLSQLNRVAKKDEKQAEQELPIEKLPEEMKTIGESLGFTTQEECDEYNQMVSDLIMSDNKVKPKFHEGEWVVFNDKHESVYQIEKIENFQYTLRHILGGSMPLSFSGEDMIRPWAIQDAKDGDVLACNEEILLFKSYSVQGRISLYCWYNGQTNNFHSKEVVDTLMTTRNKIYPATKEQRDILFSKMKEAGYTFDFEKKELKKIEQPELTEFEEAVKDMIDDYRDAIDAHAATTEEVKERAAYMLSLIPHKSAEWGEEDEKKFSDILAILRGGENCYYNSPILIDWLKSLRPQNTWKPSDEQMNALNDVISSRDIKYDVLSELWKDLNKVKGE